MIKNIKSTEAWKILNAEDDATLIDIRTEEEWKLTGMPDLRLVNKKVTLLSWRFWPEMNINNNFIRSIKNMFEKKNTTLLFICRGGHRSHQAASSAYSEGYLNNYNVIDGFEGQLNDDGHRNSIDGWKFNNLPWYQD